MYVITIIMVIAFVGVMWYFYYNPVLLPSTILNILPENIEDSFDYTSKQVSKRIETELSKATKDYRPEFNSANIEKLILKLTNEKRAGQNLSTLELDAKLAKVARNHSKDMATRDYFSHITPEGLGPSERAVKTNYSCVKYYGIYFTEGIAENLAKNWLYTSYMVRGNYISYDWNTEQSLAKQIVEGWMDSEGHRKNILTPEFDRLGVGVVITEDNAVYATQNFC